MNIGENFEGLIEKLHVNFIPYALTINNEVKEIYFFTFGCLTQLFVFYFLDFRYVFTLCSF